MVDFTPKQAVPRIIASGEVTGGATDKIAVRTVTLANIQAYSRVHDNGCGHGAVTGAIIDSFD